MSNDKLRDALKLAGNRLQRAALEAPNGSAIRFEINEWAREALAASNPEPQAQAAEPEEADRVLAELDALKDDAAVHIYPDDLEKCGRSECVVEVYSVRVGSPTRGKTVPLFSREQIVATITKAQEARKS